MAGAPSLLSPHSRSHWLGWWTWLEGIRRHAPLDWAELMSQKIPQPGLQGSPWASGETGSWGTGGEDKVRFIWGVLELVKRGQEDRGSFVAEPTRTPRGRRCSGRLIVTEWGRDYSALIRKPCLYQGFLGTSALSQVHSVHQADANPPHQAAPKVWNVPPILFLHAPSHSGPTAGRTGKGTERQREGCGKPNRSQAANIWPLSTVCWSTFS